MTVERYVCGMEARRAAVGASTTLNGIDFLEIANPGQTLLEVTFLHPLPSQPGGIPAAPPLTLDNLRIEGGERIVGVRAIKLATPQPDRLRVKVDQPGDFSLYTLRLVSGPGVDTPPAGFDPQLAAVAFSFKAACESDFDCHSEPVAGDAPAPGPVIDYLAKDYTSFRRLMLDRLAAVMPDWRPASAADPYLALIETLAYAADGMSYAQDAAATEAYLGTARSRISLRRHARLLDYTMHDGCNARVLLHLAVALGGDMDGQTLAAPAAVLTGAAATGAAIDGQALADELRAGAEVFETMQPVVLHAAHNGVDFHTWSDSRCMLAKGAIRATLVDQPPLSLVAGDLILFEQVAGPATGLAEDADPALRHVARLAAVEHGIDLLDNTPVCEIVWDAADALPFDLPIDVAPPDGSGGSVRTAVARGNIVLADHGRWVADAGLLPGVVPVEGLYEPTLLHAGITVATPLGAMPPASALLSQDLRAALPLVAISDEDEDWTVRRDLLASDRFAADVCIEFEHDGAARLRFGDGTNGKLPLGGAHFAVRYRVGNGPAGNVGADTITRIVTEKTGFLAVRNPLPAAGGTAPESAFEVRSRAPASIRDNVRAVTEADYAAAAESFEDVQRAAGRIVWTGSWHTVYVTIDRKGGLPVSDDAAFSQRLLDHLDRLRVAGYDLRLLDPVYVSLLLELHVCVRPGVFRAHVRTAMQDVFSSGVRGNGELGFFHPDHFTFGQPVYASRIYEAAMSVDGVQSVDLVKFHRWGGAPQDEIARGRLVPNAEEIIRLDNDSNFPERGKFECVVEGGL